MSDNCVLIAGAPGTGKTAALASSISGDFVLVTGATGTGKSAALVAIADRYEAADHRIIRMACTTSVVELWRHRGFPDAMTVAAELKRIKTGRTRWDARTVLIVDGIAGPSKHLTELRNQARATGAKLIIAADPNQLFFGLPGSASIVPPTQARFLLDLLLSKADRDTIPGDREEEFRDILVKYGPTRARLWFWGEVLRTIATRNPICRWFLVNGLERLVEWIFRQIGS
jgi:hypothetical protein